MPKIEDEVAWMKKGSKSFKSKGSSAPQEESLKRPTSPPPSYQTVAPARMPKEPSKALPKESSKALVPRGFHSEDDERPGKASSSRRDMDRGRKPKDDEDRYGKSRHRSLHSDDDSVNRTKRNEVARRLKPSKTKHRDDRSESESDSDRKNKKKSSGKKRESKALLKHKGYNKRKDSGSDSDSDSDGEIKEVRKRFEDISYHELNEGYVRWLEEVFGVRIAKIEAWCDDGLIQMDTLDGSYNIRKLLKKGFVEEKEKEEWAKYEKKYRKWVAETPGGEMLNIPRFKKHLKGNPGRRGLSHAGPSRGPNIVVVQNPQPVLQVMQPPLGPGERERIPWKWWGCLACESNGAYCGDPYHRGIWSR